MNLKQHIKSILKESLPIGDIPQTRITKLIKTAVEDYVTFEICKLSVIDLNEKDYAVIIITEKPIRSESRDDLQRYLNDTLPFRVLLVIEDGIFGCGKQMNESVEDTKYKKVIGKLIDEVFDGVCGFDWEVFKNYVRKGLALRITLHLTEENHGRFDFQKYHQSKTELKELLEDFFPNFSGIFIVYDTTKCGEDLNESEITERCWKGYSQKGMKTMFGKRYPNCVKIKNKKESKEGFDGYAAPAFEMEPDHVHFKHLYNESTIFNHTKRRILMINELLESLMYDNHDPCDYDDKDHYYNEIVHDLSWMVRNKKYGLDDADWIDIYEYVVDHKQKEIKQYYTKKCSKKKTKTNEGFLDDFSNLFRRKRLNQDSPDFIDSERERFTCGDCGNPDYEMYMVNDDIWSEYGNKTNTLCKSCLEKRMGRRLTKDAFSQHSNVPVNQHNTEVRDLMKETIRRIFNEEVTKKYSKPTEKVDKLVYGWLDDYFDGSQMYKKESWKYYSFHFEFCKNGREIAELNVRFEDKSPNFGPKDKRPTNERSVDEVWLYIYPDMIDEILTYIPIRKNYLLYLIEEWFEDTKLDEIQREFNRNDLSLDYIFVSESKKKGELCVPPVPKPEGITDQEMKDLIKKNTLYSYKDMDKHEEEEPGWIEDTYMGILQNQEHKRVNDEDNEGTLREEVEELKKSSVKDSLQQIIDDDGVISAAELVGGLNNLIKTVYDGDIKEFSKDTGTKLVWISIDGTRMFIHEVLVDRLGLEDISWLSRPEKGLGDFRYGSKNGTQYKFTARITPITINGQPYYKVVGTSGDSGFGYGFISQKNLLGKRYRAQIFQQIIDKYNLQEYM